jgi:hypothetical protein
MLFAKFRFQLSGIIGLIATGFPLFLTSAIAHDDFLSLHRQSINQTTLSQGLESDNSGLIMPRDERDWQDIFQSLKQKEEEEPSLNSRSPLESICIASPAIFGGIKNWHISPLFIWQGTLDKIEVISRNTYQPMWSQDILPEQRSILYQGQPLEPGNYYEVVIYYESSSQPIRFTLEFLTYEEIQRISGELKIGEESLLVQGADPETIARYRARYFMENNLLSEAVQEILAVENPSNELKEIQQDTIEMLCDRDRPTK